MDGGVADEAFGGQVAFCCAVGVVFVLVEGGVGGEGAGVEEGCCGFFGDGAAAGVEGDDAEAGDEDCGDEDR